MFLLILLNMLNIYFWTVGQNKMNSRCDMFKSATIQYLDQISV